MKKWIIIFLVTTFPVVALAQKQIDMKFWEPIMEAVAQIESSQNAKAISRSGTYVGYLQISKVLVNDVNEYLGYKKYTYDDRYSIQKSKEMFVLTQERYNKSKNTQKAIRLWAGGCNGWNKPHTLTYYNKVMNKFKLTATL